VSARGRGPVTLVTGGAGFIGTNVADRLLSEGRRVRVYDNLSRPGVERNLRWLVETHGARVDVVAADVSDRAALGEALAGVSQVFHFAAQVAVTTSVVDPLLDYVSNVQGTVFLLEELRRLVDPPPLLFTSTNKVYGALPDLDLVREGDRWEPEDRAVRARGLSERRPLDFCTPYGCSKGAADQYVLDYAKTFDLPAVVFRMSCIYGPHQHGTEDQGWVAHFLLRTLAGQPITIYGDGAQVRDVLYAADLVDAMLAALGEIDALAGTPFNIGGGAENSISLLEFLDLVGEVCGERPRVTFSPERVGDQRYYVADTARLRRATGWRPQVGVRDGIELLHRWLAGRRGARVRTAVG
jgi:CDP-paratose 2-epimerase